MRRYDVLVNATLKGKSDLEEVQYWKTEAREYLIKELPSNTAYEGMIEFKFLISTEYSVEAKNQKEAIKLAKIKAKGQFNNCSFTLEKVEANPLRQYLLDKPKKPKTFYVYLASRSSNVFTVDAHSFDEAKNLIRYALYTYPVIELDKVEDPIVVCLAPKDKLRGKCPIIDKPKSNDCIYVEKEDLKADFRIISNPSQLVNRNIYLKQLRANSHDRENEFRTFLCNDKQLPKQVSGNKERYKIRVIEYRKKTFALTALSYDDACDKIRKYYSSDEIKLNRAASENSLYFQLLPEYGKDATDYEITFNIDDRSLTLNILNRKIGETIVKKRGKNAWLYLASKLKSS